MRYLVLVPALVVVLWVLWMGYTGMRSLEQRIGAHAASLVE